LGFVLNFFNNQTFSLKIFFPIKIFQLKKFKVERVEKVERGENARGSSKATARVERRQRGARDEKLWAEKTFPSSAPLQAWFCRQAFR